MATSAKKPELEQDVLDAELERGYPPSWQPEPGETIKGVFLRLEQGNTQFGPAPIVIVAVEPDGEERSVWVFYESLKTQLLRAAPAAGERVAIRYDGQQQVKNPTAGRRSTFHAYRVAVDRPKQQTGPVDWQASLGVPERVAAQVAAAPEPDVDDIPF